MPDYDGMTIEELEAELRRLDEERLAVRDRAREARAARDRLIHAEQARALADGLSDEQKVALAQHLALTGVGGAAKAGAAAAGA